MYLLSLLRNKLLEKILVLCIMAAVFSVTASADVIIDTSLISFGFSTLTVEIDGEISNALSDKYVYGDVVTLNAPDIDGKIFNYWANEEGKPISYNKELTLTIYSNTVLSAVYGTASVTPQPSTEFLSIFHSLGMFMFNVAATAPSGSTVTEYGIRYSTTKSSLEDLKGNDGVTVKTAYSNSDSNSLFDVVGSNDKVCYVVSYVRSGGQTYYSEVKAAELSNLRRGTFYVAGLANIQEGVSFDAVCGSPDVLRAVLRENLLKVSFNANGGTGTMTPQGFLKNSPFTIAPAKFTRDYYTFNSWNTNANGSGTSYKDEASISLTQSITLYAQWKPIQYTITYELNGGTNNAENPTSYTIESATITLKAPTRTNYDFVGWTCNGESITKIATGSTGDKILTAVWKVVESANPASPADTPGASDDPATPGTSDSTQVSAEKIANMTSDDIANTLGNKTEIALTGNVENLSKIIERLETLTDVKTLDLSQITGATELKLEQTTLENIKLEDNQSIKKVEITTETLITLNLARSKVETVDVEGCKNLFLINVEGAENLTSLNVKETKITTLNVKDCAKLKMLDAKGCSDLEEVNLEGCQSLEYLNVSETAITKLDVQNCIQLGTLYCASCDIDELNLDGCDNLATLDCSNNSLLMLNASGFTYLHSLECKHQRAVKPLAILMNFIDLLLRRGRFAVSDANEDSTYLENVKNLKAYNEIGNSIGVASDDNGNITFSSKPDKITYDYDTGFDNTMMDVEISASASESETITGDSSSNAGCTSGFGTWALAILMLLLILTSETKATK